MGMKKIIIGSLWMVCLACVAILFLIADGSYNPVHLHEMVMLLFSSFTIFLWLSSFPALWD